MLGSTTGGGGRGGAFVVSSLGRGGRGGAPEERERKRYKNHNIFFC